MNEIRRNRKEKEAPKQFWETLMFKLFSKFALALLVTVVFLSLVQCSIETPQAPSWSSSMSIPVVNRTYTMEEMMNKIDSDGLGVDSQGTMTYSFDQNLDTVTLSQDLLTTPDFFLSVFDSIGPIAITPPTSAPLLVSLLSIGGLASSLPGDSAFIPTIDFNITNDIPTVETYSTATIATGSIVAVVDNSLGIDLDTLIIQLFDLNLLKFVATDTFPNGLANNTIDSISIDMSGETISSDIRLISYCYTEGGTVDSASIRYISTSMSFSDPFTVSTANTMIPPVIYNFSDQAILTEAEPIDSALLSAGNISLTVVNESYFGANLTITIPDFVINGTPLTIIQSLTAQQIAIVNVDLAGYKLLPSDNLIPQAIDLNIVVDVPGTGTTRVLVSENDNFQLSASLTGLQFASVSGKFNAQAANFSSTQQIANIPTGFDSLQFKNVQLTLEIDNQIDLPGDLNITLTGNNGKSINLSGGITENAITNLFLGDSTVASFLSPIPSQIDVVGSVLMGDSLYSGTIADGDFITATIYIYAPLAVVIDNYTFESDIATESVDSSTADAVTKHLINAKLIYSIDNRIPIGGNISMFISDDSLTLFSNPILKFDSLTIVPALVDSLGFANTIQSTGDIEIFIDSSQIDILNRGQLYIAHQVSLAGSNGQTVILNQNDYLTILARIEIEYLFDGKF